MQVACETMASYLRLINKICKKGRYPRAVSEAFVGQPVPSGHPRFPSTSCPTLQQITGTVRCFIYEIRLYQIYCRTHRFEYSSYDLTPRR